MAYEFQTQFEIISFASSASSFSANRAAGKSLVSTAGDRPDYTLYIILERCSVWLAELKVQW